MFNITCKTSGSEVGLQVLEPMASGLQDNLCNHELSLEHMYELLNSYTLADTEAVSV